MQIRGLGISIYSVGGNIYKIIENNMAKTSLELYQDIDAIDEAGRGQLTTNLMLQGIALSLANLATALESMNAFERGPEVTTVTAATLYAEAAALNEKDGDVTMTNYYIKLIGRTSAKLAMEAEAIRTGMWPQLFSYEANVAISFGGGANDLLSYREDLGANILLGVGKEFLLKRAVAAGISLTSGVEKRFIYEAEASVSTSVAFDHNRPYSAKVFGAGTALTAEFQSV